MSGEITQADREAAANYLRYDALAEGAHDHHPLVSAFARHAAQARLEGATEMRHAALRACADQSWMDPPLDKASACSRRIREIDPAEIAAIRALAGESKL